VLFSRFLNKYLAKNKFGGITFWAFLVRIMTEYLESYGVSNLGRGVTFKPALPLLALQAVCIGNLLTDKKSYCMKNNRLITYQHYKMCCFERTAGSNASDT
jgi:hypothetical protein